tara:strand:- start:254194 stop:255156 length:963 start_codon:yes stop_codon:yes gene_type:complete
MKKLCRICHQNTDAADYVVQEMMFGTGESFDYFQCQQCHCLQISNIPDNLADYYANDYYSKENDFASADSSGKQQRIINSLRHYLISGGQGSVNFKNEEFDVVTRVKMRQESKILDVGCGSGRLPYVLREAGFENVSGVDPFIENEIEYPNGLKIYNRHLEDLPAEWRWDFITFHHSFEHIVDQHKTLSECVKRLEDGGRIIIRIPVLGFAWRKYGVHWYQLDAPRHLYLHSRQSISSLAGEHGLRIEKLIFDSNASQFLISEKYKQGVPLIHQKKGNRLKRLLNKWQKFKYKRLSRKLNKNSDGDQAVFILTRSAASQA